METPKIDETIARAAYILDSLRALREIQETGSCNDCMVKCIYRPKPGQMVRYNCPFYMGQKGEKGCPDLTCKTQKQKNGDASAQ